MKKSTQDSSTDDESGNPSHPDIGISMDADMSMEESNYQVLPSVSSPVVEQDKPKWDYMSLDMLVHCFNRFQFMFINCRPLTAYAHFFNDTQQSIRNKNATATFEEVSRIVNSMWESLDANTKLVKLPSNLHNIIDIAELLC